MGIIKHYQDRLIERQSRKAATEILIGFEYGGLEPPFVTKIGHKPFRMDRKTHELRVAETVVSKLGSLCIAELENLAVDERYIKRNINNNGPNTIKVIECIPDED
jgi:hypothetical protein